MQHFCHKYSRATANANEIAKMDKREWDSPGERALVAMKSLSKNVSVFKIPKAPAKKKAKKLEILTEEKYIEVKQKISLLKQTKTLFLLIFRNLEK